jgi:hypothetical protein
VRVICKNTARQEIFVILNINTTQLEKNILKISSTDKRKPNPKWKHRDPRAVQPVRGMVPRSGGLASVTQVCYVIK